MNRISSSPSPSPSPSSSSASPPRRRRKPIIGVCAMDSKVRSKPMRSILSRLASTTDFELIFFGDKAILDDPPSLWPKCDFLIAFHSRGFPLDKAIEYVALRQPYCVNDVQLQKLLQDRRMVLAVLDAIDVPTPKRLWTSRDGGPQCMLSADLAEAVSRDFGVDFTIPRPAAVPQHVTFDQDKVSVNGQSIKLPFVEKPADAENHNINVFLAADKMRVLFRKIGNKSSELICNQPVSLRQDGQDYVYEEFLQSDNSEDVKLYTVGPYYVYAESRKAPTKDGRVERNADGKELRYPTQLTKEEQEIARRVCMAFGQTVCGFDLLRCNGRPYVIDVNGWSFVKGNEEYYDRCAQILRDTFLRVSRRSMLLSSEPHPLFPPSSSTTHSPSEWRLETCIAVFRHADRTPKQKFKTQLTDSTFDILKKGVILTEVYGQSSIKDLMNQVKPLDEHLYHILKKQCRVPGTKVQLQRTKSPAIITVTVKWGGEFTHAGRHQAKDVGESMRTDLTLLMTAEDGDGDGRRELLTTANVKVHASRERRVVATANVFSKAFLKTAELPSDFVLIDIRPPAESDAIKAKEIIEVVKKRMFMGREGELEQLFVLLESVKKSMDERAVVLGGGGGGGGGGKGFVSNVQDYHWCCSDSPMLFKERWDRLFSGILNHKHSLDPARLFDLYDSLKYDLIHHKEFITAVAGANLLALADCVQSLFNTFSSRQYGETKEERIVVARLLAASLLNCLIDNMAVSDGHSNCFFYFTKESVLHCLYSLFQDSFEGGGLRTDIGELDYLAQIDIEVWRRGAEKTVRVGVRQGAHLDCLSAGFSSTCIDHHALTVSQRRVVTDHVEFNVAINRLRRHTTNNQL